MAILDVKHLGESVANDAAIRRRQTLQPAGGKGEKITGRMPCAEQERSRGDFQKCGRILHLGSGEALANTALHKRLAVLTPITLALLPVAAITRQSARMSMAPCHSPS